MRRVLVTGAGGLLGGYLVRALAESGAEVVAWNGTRDVNLEERGRVAEAVRSARPQVVVHTAALAREADCWRDPARAERVNTAATQHLVKLAADAGCRLVYVSTDLVFDGTRGPYREEDPPTPLSVYGRTKAAAEPAVLALPGGLVVRASLLYGQSLTGRPTFFDDQLAALREGRPVTLFEDEWRTPLDVSTAARALAGLAASDCTGVLHLGGPERMSRWEMGQRMAAYLGRDLSCLRAARRADVPSPEPRPRDTSLDSSRWRGLFPSGPWPTLEEALAEPSA